LSSGLLSENLKVKIYKTIKLPVLLYGCETFSNTLMKELQHKGTLKQDPEANIWTQDECKWREEVVPR
jgi:hypothetical protein